MNFRDHPLTRHIRWESIGWARSFSGTSPLLNINDAVLRSVRESRSQGLRIDVSIGGHEPTAVLPEGSDPVAHWDAEFVDYLKGWLRDRIGSRLGDLYDDEVEWPTS